MDMYLVYFWLLRAARNSLGHIVSVDRYPFSRNTLKIEVLLL